MINVFYFLKLDDPNNWNSSESEIVPEEKYSVYRKFRKQTENKKNVHKVRDGDYIYGEGVHGVYYV